jgi:hypothetical protein
MKMTAFFLLFFYSASLWSQQPIRGKVIDSASQKPLVKASVFINGTSIGGTTDEWRDNR